MNHVFTDICVVITMNVYENLNLSEHIYSNNRCKSDGGNLHNREFWKWKHDENQCIGGNYFAPLITVFYSLFFSKTDG